MPHSIYKYSLPHDPGRHLVNLPRGARVLSFGSQSANLVFWALVDPDNKVEDRAFHLHFTGQPFEYTPRQDDIFVGTVQIGPIVWHLFEARNV